jgi:hypothetical protein
MRHTPVMADAVARPLVEQGVQGRVVGVVGGGAADEQR